MTSTKDAELRNKAGGQKGDNSNQYIRTILRATSMMITDTDNDQLNYWKKISIIQLVIISVGYHHWSNQYVQLFLISSHLVCYDYETNYSKKMGITFQWLVCKYLSKIDEKVHPWRVIIISLHLSLDCLQMMTFWDTAPRLSPSQYRFFSFTTPTHYHTWDSGTLITRWNTGWKLA